MTEFRNESGQYVRYLTEWMSMTAVEIPSSHYLMTWEQDLRSKILTQVQAWIQEPDSTGLFPIDGSAPEMTLAAEIDLVLTSLERLVPGYRDFPQGATLAETQSWMDRPPMLELTALGSEIRQMIDSQDLDWLNSQEVMMGQSMIRWDPLEWFPTELIVISQAAQISDPFGLIP